MLGEEPQFHKVNQTDSKSHGYDYDSIMHYHSTDFSKNGNKTITAKNGHPIGEGRSISVIDAQEAMTMFPACHDRTTKIVSSEVLLFGALELLLAFC
jgi:hypothetical protein